MISVILRAGKAGSGAREGQKYRDIVLQAAGERLLNQRRMAKCSYQMRREPKRLTVIM